MQTTHAIDDTVWTAVSVGVGGSGTHRAGRSCINSWSSELSAVSMVSSLRRVCAESFAASAPLASSAVRSATMPCSSFTRIAASSTWVREVR